MRILNVHRLLGAALGLALFALAGQATASTMSDCSAQYKAAKAAGKLPSNMTWPKYFGECAKKAKAASAKRSKTTKSKTTKTASKGKSVMAQCSAQYKADKAAKKLKAGETWRKYYSQCAAELKAEASAPEPTAASVKAPLPKKDKNGKALSPGQIAFYKRERECGQMWRTAKAAGKTKGLTWPKYLSSCNAKLKAQGK